MESQKSITIGDIAKELGVSKTTVSRAISGKGRIGDETRAKVINYIKENDYKPNLIAKSLAKSKTYNIGVVLPTDSVMGVPFFQTCLMGICEAVASFDYDVVVTTASDTDITLLKRIIENKKVDGIVVARSLVNDLQVKYLLEKKVPFVMVGSSDEKGVYQIDTDHMEGCSKLTSYLLMTGGSSIAYFSMNQKHIVERNRYLGFCQAFEDRKMKLNETNVYLNLSTKTLAKSAVETVINKGVDCIVCSDDVMCNWVLSILQELQYNVPQDVKVAAFYNSMFLENHNPPITTIDIDVKELGFVAGKQIVRLLNGEEIEAKTLLNYNILMKQSTKS